MYNVVVSLTKVDAPLPTGVIFGHTNLDVTDSKGAVQHFALTGAETIPWTQAVVGLADGASNYTAQDVDANGRPIGAAITASFTPTAVTFPATRGITIDLA